MIGYHSGDLAPCRAGAEQHSASRATQPTLPGGPITSRPRVSRLPSQGVPSRGSTPTPSAILHNHMMHGSQRRTMVPKNTREFARYITPEEALKAYLKRNKEEVKKNNDKLCAKERIPSMSTIEYWRRLQSRTGLCESCEEEPIWRYGGCEMCFTCTTGESDMSEDFELELP